MANKGKKSTEIIEVFLFLRNTEGETDMAFC